MDINKLCYDVIGAAMRVQQYLGNGYLEEVYKNSLKNHVNPVNHVKNKRIEE